MMDSNRTDLDKYLNDISTIKKLMTKYDEQPVVEYWAFFTWGFLIALSSLLHFFVASPPDMPARFHYLYIWIPCLLTGGALETIAWLRQTARTDALLGSRKLIKTYISMIINLVAVIFIFIYSLTLPSHNPGVIILCFSCAMTFVAHASYGAIFVEAALTMVIGIILIMVHATGWLPNVFAGLYIAAMMVTMGIHSRVLEYRNRE
ncbi:MAG: hypothetical protein JXB03_11790 [Spirochaetales bacterium]|nr:hypothetical protein [Spirochaetales bacterium]